jgi:hypothetical protein
VECSIFNFSSEVKWTLCSKRFKHIRTKQERSLYSNINSISISVQCFIDKPLMISKHSRGLCKQQMPLTDSHNLHFDRSTNRPWIPLHTFTLRQFWARGTTTTQKYSHEIRDGADQFVGVWIAGESGFDSEPSQEDMLFSPAKAALVLSQLYANRKIGVIYTGINFWLHELYERVEPHLHYTTHL